MNLAAKLPCDASATTICPGTSEWYPVASLSSLDIGQTSCLANTDSSNDHKACSNKMPNFQYMMALCHYFGSLKHLYTSTDASWIYSAENFNRKNVAESKIC